MNPLSPMSYVPSLVVGTLADRVSAWAVESQQGARRNAMVATTALATRRAERQEVEAYLAAGSPPSTAPQVPSVARR
jgi:hypothetical protein